MSYLLNDPATFADESADGFVAAHADLVRRVTGGVARRTATPAGEVALVIGGGSGHYPSFAGLVGPGLAHAAAMGNVFASPSAAQIYAVARSVATEAGVLLSYGNYAGDVLNFDQAQARLRDAGVPCESVPVTDDIFSAGRDERDKRRGIAGDLVVFRAAGWAAAQGRSLADVAALARRANDRTRTIGVAFSGCTLPGADAPLFTVPEGQMAVGMGIHGEPGIETAPLPTARALAEMFVERLLDERPDGVEQGGPARVAVVLNGLGSIKGEELFVVYRDIAELLETAGLEIVAPEVGEFATSFEMAGLSLSLAWLDDELEQTWTAPAYSAAFRTGTVALADLGPSDDSDPVAHEEAAAMANASEASRAAAVVARDAIAAIRRTIEDQADELGRLDSIAGDGDHGIGMRRGSAAADEAAGRAAEAGAGIGTLLAQAGDAWADKAGGTSGALWGAALRAVGESLGDTDVPDGARVAAAVSASRDAVQQFGHAEVGDKTMVDALVPFAETLSEQTGQGEGLRTGWTAAAERATSAAQATADLLPRLGRARPHLEKSRGTPDPGAISFGLVVTAVGEILTAPADGTR